MLLYILIYVHDVCTYVENSTWRTTWYPVVSPGNIRSFNKINKYRYVPGTCDFKFQEAGSNKLKKVHYIHVVHMYTYKHDKYDQLCFISFEGTRLFHWVRFLYLFQFSFPLLNHLKCLCL